MTDVRERAGDREREPGQSSPWGRIVAWHVCLFVIVVGVTWAFVSMRAVMDVGGSCASGGAYEIATPCPDGSWLIAVAIPAMMVAAFGGTFLGPDGAPILFVPLWGFLFGALGWNFWEYGVAGPDVGFIICGVLFVLMAAPALIGMAVAFAKTLRRTAFPTEKELAARSSYKPYRPTGKKAAKLAEAPAGPWWWVGGALVTALGFWVGLLTYAAAA